MLGKRAPSLMSTRLTLLYFSGRATPNSAASHRPHVEEAADVGYAIRPTTEVSHCHCETWTLLQQEIGELIRGISNLASSITKQFLLRRPHPDRVTGH
ncbi:hypothetical protein KIN20_014075 [Parelaphostrongylus tenuis]|uniref:Uncharacterized protein n=1 Tax=Parelaphostrongylus tenuis TaxID=148309 RepID=A0AAD5MYH2_PARTN|nr:hypothetical protein KIN20_014075 [Parelaphostrongylus tenuis]